MTENPPYKPSTGTLGTEKSMLTCCGFFFEIDAVHYCCISCPFLPFLVFSKLQILKTFLEATPISTNYQKPIFDHLFVASLIIFSFNALYWNVNVTMLKQGLIKCAYSWNHKGFERSWDYHALACTGSYNCQKKSLKTNGKSYGMGRRMIVIAIIQFTNIVFFFENLVE